MTATGTSLRLVCSTHPRIARLISSAVEAVTIATAAQTSSVGSMRAAAICKNYLSQKCYTFSLHGLLLLLVYCYFSVEKNVNKSFRRQALMKPLL